jgi:pimeloyl-ACP methyl ester carboxylesterase
MNCTDDGYNVAAPRFPESSLAADVVRLRQVLARQDGPTLAVGHSYDGQIITALSTDAPNVVGLVYIAGLGLDEGESIGALPAQGPFGLPWRTSTSTSRASPGSLGTTTSTTSPPMSIQSRQGSYTRSSTRCTGAPSRR